MTIPETPNTIRRPDASEADQLNEAEIEALRLSWRTEELARCGMGEIHGRFISTTYKTPTKSQRDQVAARIRASSSPRTFAEVLISAEELRDRDRTAALDSN